MYKLQIWDTAGQESFRSITKIFYRNAHAVILAYSIANRDTFDSLETWLLEVNNSCDTKDLIIFLVGNKADLEDEREVSRERMQAFAKENDIIYITETSAKNGQNVERLFIAAAKYLYKKYADIPDKDF